MAYSGGKTNQLLGGTRALGRTDAGDRGDVEAYADCCKCLWDSTKIVGILEIFDRLHEKTGATLAPSSPAVSFRKPSDICGFMVSLAFAEGATNGLSGRR